MNRENGGSLLATHYKLKRGEWVDMAELEKYKKVRKEIEEEIRAKTRAETSDEEAKALKPISDAEFRSMREKALLDLKVHEKILTQLANGTPRKDIPKMAEISKTTYDNGMAVLEHAGEVLSARKDNPNKYNDLTVSVASAILIGITPPLETVQTIPEVYTGLIEAKAKGLKYRGAREELSMDEATFKRTNTALKRFLRAKNEEHYVALCASVTKRSNKLNAL